jgi:hypothetical protein
MTVAGYPTLEICPWNLNKGTEMIRQDAKHLYSSQSLRELKIRIET